MKAFGHVPDGVEARRVYRRQACSVVTQSLLRGWKGQIISSAQRPVPSWARNACLNSEIVPSLYFMLATRQRSQPLFHIALPTWSLEDQVAIYMARHPLLNTFLTGFLPSYCSVSEGESTHAPESHLVWKKSLRKCLFFWELMRGMPFQRARKRGPQCRVSAVSEAPWVSCLTPELSSVTLTFSSCPPWLSRPGQATFTE